MNGLRSRGASVFGCIFNSLKMQLGNRTYSDGRKNYVIRNITEDDIPRICEIRKTLKLPDAVSTLSTFHKLDPEAIVVAEDDDGHIIATHMLLNFADGFCSSGLTWVHDTYRKGGELLLQMIDKTKPHRKNRVLVGCTNEKLIERSYTTSGLVKTNIKLVRSISTEAVDYNHLSDDLPGDVELRIFGEGHLDLVYNYDLQLMKYDRRRFLELSLIEPNSRTLVALRNGACVGFGTIKLTLQGTKRVGPLYADNPNIAEVMLKALLADFKEGKGVVVVVPSLNVPAVDLIGKLKIPVHNILFLLSQKKLPEMNVNKVYAHFDVNGTIL